MPKFVTYSVHIEPAKESGYIASFPAIPGCFAQGETFNEVLAMAKEALAGFLELLRAQGQPIPAASSAHRHFILELPLSVTCLPLSITDLQ